MKKVLLCLVTTAVCLVFNNLTFAQYGGYTSNRITGDAAARRSAERRRLQREAVETKRSRTQRSSGKKVSDNSVRKPVGSTSQSPEETNISKYVEKVLFRKEPYSSYLPDDILKIYGSSEGFNLILTFTDTLSGKTQVFNETVKDGYLYLSNIPRGIYRIKGEAIYKDKKYKVVLWGVAGQKPDAEDSRFTEEITVDYSNPKDINEAETFIDGVNDIFFRITN